MKKKPSVILVRPLDVSKFCVWVEFTTLIISWIIMILCTNVSYDTLYRRVDIVKWVVIVSCTGIVMWNSRIINSENPLMTVWWDNHKYIIDEKFRLLGGLLWHTLENDYDVHIKIVDGYLISETNPLRAIAEVFEVHEKGKKIKQIRKEFAQAFFDYLYGRKDEIPMCKGRWNQRLAFWAASKAYSLEIIAFSYLLYLNEPEDKDKKTNIIEDLIWEYMNSDLSEKYG